MNNRRTFSVAAIGLADSDLRLLKTLCMLSSTRVRAYALADAGAEPEIFLADGDSAGSVAQWKAAHARKAAPTLIIKKEPAAIAHHYVVQRPLVASRMLAALDEITTKEHRFFPELVIGREESLANPVATPTQTPTAAAARFRVLVVDDSVTVRRQLELGLKLAQVHVDCTETAEEALELLVGNAYDAAFLDVVLPGMDGYQLCKKIKGDKAKKQMPVIMLTGKSSPFDRVRGALSGCDTYLTKPLQNDVFQEVIRKYLVERPAPDKLAAAPQ